MPFIGNQPALSYTSFAKQDFTTSATTSYTLDHPVTNENEIALFINFVRQEPSTAYTASNTTLTLTSATSASDDMYCVFLGKAVQTVNPPNSSVGNSQLDVSAINSQTAETSIAGGDEVLIYDTSASALRKMTRTNFVSGIGGTNTPAFRAYQGSAQNISNNTATKCQINTEDFDTDSDYDHSTNYRFTPSVAGKYYVYAQTTITNSTTANALTYTVAIIRKNGSEILRSNMDPNDSQQHNQNANFLATVIDMNGSSDYLELFAQSNATAGSAQVGDGTNQTWFGAYKIIE